jgi:integrase/recombinase XerD
MHRLPPKQFGQCRVHVAVILILDCGLRISEVLHLRRSDIDFDNTVLKVFGKGQKERLVPFSPELRKRLYRFDQLKAKKGIAGEFLFADTTALAARSGTRRHRSR